MKTLKNILKWTAATLAGFFIGFALVTAGFVLFTDETLADVTGKFTLNAAAGALADGLAGIAAMAMSLVLQILIHEGGHWVCGRLSGYRFVSFRVFNFTFIREGGRLRVKRFGIAGTGGQCLLAPPELPLPQIPVVLYNLGGVLANVLASSVGLALLILLPDTGIFLHIFLLMFTVVGFFLALLNGIPMRMGGIGNDAYNMRFLRRNPLAKQAMMTQLRINALSQWGMRPQEMPPSLYAAPEGTLDYGDPLQATLALIQTELLLDRCQWEEAYQALGQVNRHRDEIIGLLCNELDCELVFTALVTGRTDEARVRYTADLQKYIETYSSVMSAKQRLLFAIALYQEHDTEKARRIHKQLQASADRYLMQGEVKSDLAMLDELRK